MAYNKGEDLQNRINKLSNAVLAVKVIKFLFFFYSFISFLFWFLNCFEIDWLYLFQWLFIISYKLVKIFYSPQGLSADFTLAIIGVISLIIGLICEFLLGNFYQKISDLQDELENYIEQKKRTRPRKPRPIPVENYNNGAGDGTNIDEHPILIFLIQPHVHKIKNDKTDLELTFQEVEIWKQRVNKSILENIKYSQPLQKGYYRKNLFIVYKDFNYSDEFIYYINPTISSVIKEFLKYDINLEFNYVLSSAPELSKIEKELDFMDTILSLNFTNTFILTNRFKTNYERKINRKYTMIMKGEYNLSKNLSISNIQPLFIFKDIQNQGEKK